MRRIVHSLENACYYLNGQAILYVHCIYSIYKIYVGTHQHMLLLLSFYLVFLADTVAREH
jgi:hypothetical protein